MRVTVSNKSSEWKSYPSWDNWVIWIQSIEFGLLSFPVAHNVPKNVYHPSEIRICNLNFKSFRFNIQLNVKPLITQNTVSPVVIRLHFTVIAFLVVIELFRGTVHLKVKILSSLSHSCCSKPVWLYLCNIKEDIFFICMENNNHWDNFQMTMST